MADFSEVVGEQDESQQAPFDFAIDPDKFAEQVEEAHSKLKYLSTRLGVPAPELGDPIDLIYMRLLVALEDRLSIVEAVIEDEGL